MCSRPERVWYVAYGSNVNEARFLRYLVGDDIHRGARDATPPAGAQWTTAPLRLRFAGESTRWGGGVCFVDPDPDASAFVRAWDITTEQFEDVFAQENRLAETVAFDWDAVAAGPTVIGTGWYSLLLPVELDFATAEYPAVTFTWSKPMPPNRPVTAYRTTIADGLAEHPGLSPAAIEAYLTACSEATD